jgi:hypothetical protein
MPTSRSRVATTVPRRYLGQLCKHFEHKLPVTLDAASGSIAFSAGLCSLSTETDALVMQVDAADDEGLARLEDVVARHLLRFAFREPPEIVWTRVEPVSSSSQPV